MSLTFIMFIFLILMIVQWVHPLTVSYIYRLIFTKRLIAHYVLGIILSLLFVTSILLYYFDDSIRQVFYSYLLASAVVLGIVNNISFSVYISRAIDSDNELNVSSSLKITGFGSIIFLLIVSINSIVANNSTILFSYLMFDGINPIFYTLIMNLFLFALAFVIVYVYSVYVLILLNINHNQKTSEIIHKIKNHLNHKSIGFVALCGLFFCYFYLASIYPPGVIYRTIFQNTLSIFHLMTASIFIPLVLDKFISKRG